MAATALEDALRARYEGQQTPPPADQQAGTIKLSDEDRAALVEVLTQLSPDDLRSLVQALTTQDKQGEPTTLAEALTQHYARLPGGPR